MVDHSASFCSKLFVPGVQKAVWLMSTTKEAKSINADTYSEAKVSFPFLPGVLSYAPEWFGSHTYVCVLNYKGVGVQGNR